MSSPGTVEWFIERGVPEPRAAELAAIEAGVGHGCTPHAPAEGAGGDPLADVDASTEHMDDPDAPVIEPGELDELGDLDSPI
jgi:hypothetical protein